MRKKPHTHTAWGVMQIGRRHRDTGIILLLPHDAEPPDLNKAQRPGGPDEIEDEGVEDSDE
jgi:hypothetical protein